MKKILDKLSSKIKINKKVLVFLMVLALIALISGSIFVVMLNKHDKSIVTNYLNEFIENICKNKVDYLFVLKDSLISNITLIISIWLLGISVIGIPIILFLFFSQIFTFGFALASIILNYKFKGLLLAFLYTFPNYIIYFMALFIIVSYSLILSIKFIYSVINKKQIDFKIVSNRYLLVLVFSLIAITLCSLYETFVFPSIIRLITPILK